VSPKEITLPLDIYVRVSRVGGREGESFIAPDEQEARCRALAAARGYQVGKVLVDLDDSGGKTSRSQLDEAIARVEAGESGGIIVARIDRFARTLVGGLVTFERINLLGGVVIVADGEFDTSTATGELVLNLMLGLAQFELRRIREGWDTSTRNAIDRGVWMAAKVPFGYVKNGDGRLHPDPVTSPIVRELFAKRAAGTSWRDLCRFVDARAPRGTGKWPPSTLVGIIGSDAYLGVSRQGDRVVNTDAHEALVTRTEWEAAQSVKATVTARGSGALLAGIVRCSGCGFVMSQTTHGSSRVGAKRYVCKKIHAAGRCPRPMTADGPSVDLYVETRFLELLAQTPIRSVEVLERRESLAEAVNALETAEGELTAYLGSVSAAMVGAEAFAAAALKRRQAIEEAQAHVSVVRTSIPTIDLPADNLRDAWPELTVDERRAILTAALDAVVVWPPLLSGSRGPVGERLQILLKGEAPPNLPGRRNPQMQPFERL
jgi:site-specific DNA recombinase